VFPDRVKSLALTLDYTEGQALDYIIDRPQKEALFFLCLSLFFHW